MKITKRIYALISFPILFALSAASLIGCSQYEYGMVEIKSGPVRDALVNYTFNTRQLPLGGYGGLPYYYLWDGYGEYQINYGGAPRTIPKEERLHTYHLDWGELSHEYYFVYMTDSVLKGAKTSDGYEFLSEEAMQQLIRRAGDVMSAMTMCNFAETLDSRFIDGKYLCQHNNYVLERDDLTVYQSNSLEKIPLHLLNKTMVFAARKKKLTILEDLSASKTLNRSIDLYCRIGLSFGVDRSHPPRSGNPSFA